MSLLDDIKAKADVNGDGKITADDLESLKDGVHNDKLDELKKFADQNDDGKLSLDDLSSFNLNDTVEKAKDAFGGDVLDQAKDKLGGIFGGKS